MADETTINLDNTKIVETLNQLNTAMTGDGSPYKAMIDFVNTAALNNILDSVEKVQVIASMMANSVSNISLNVLNSAIEIEKIKLTTQKELELRQAQIDLTAQQKLTEVQQTAKVSYEVNTLLPQDSTLKIKQISISDKQITGFDKDMYYKVLSKTGETTQMLAAAGATDGYSWLADAMKLSIEKMTDGKINIISNTTGTTVNLNNTATDANGLSS